MIKRYGKEQLEVCDYDPNWYDAVEEEIKGTYEIEIQKVKQGLQEEIGSMENSDITLEEVKDAIFMARSKSAPSPEE